MRNKSRGQYQENSAQDDFEYSERSEYWLNYKPATRGAPKKFKYREPLILCGHGVRIRIDHNTLLIRNGFTHYPQKAEKIRLFPGDANLPDRIIVLDGSGGITFDAMTWMVDQKIGFIQLDWQGYSNFMGGAWPYCANPKLVKLQSAIRGTKKAVDINRQLIRAKFSACIETISTVFPKSEISEIAIRKLRNWHSQLSDPRKSSSISKILGFEGAAAIAYYKPWQEIALKWSGLSRRPIPPDWNKIGPRSMTWRRRGNNARHPINAMLNYAYGVLIGQFRKEIVAAGLDPSIGIVHSNPENPIPLVYDLMEPLRPVVDRAVLEFALSHTFTPGDFTINKWGGCRLNPQMARVVANRLAAMSAAGAVNGFLKQLQ
jgi:CRISPR-associated endonuclease Cas1